MHMLTGLLLGEMLLGAGALKARGKKALPFELLHVLPGRVRVRVSALVGQASLANAVEGVLSGIAGVQRASADPRSGSVLVLFDDTAENRKRLIAALDEFAKSVPAPQPQAAPAQGDPPLLRQRLLTLGRQANRTVMERTQGATDLVTLLGVLAGLWGLKIVLFPGTGARWPGMSLMWWSYNLLRRG